MAARRPVGRTHGAFMAGLTAFGIALGHLQALLVVFMWRALDMALPPRAHSLIATLERAPDWLASAAQGSQVAIAIAVLSGAWLAGRSPAERLGALFYVSGLVLAVRYLALAALTGWPDSLEAMDGGIGPFGAFAVRVWILLVASGASVAIGLVFVNLARRSAS